jgi:hypothetical protein
MNRWCMALAPLLALALAVGAIGCRDLGTPAVDGTVASATTSSVLEDSGDGLPHWTKLTTVNAPSVRLGHTLVYDPATDKVLLFGGTTDSMILPQSWFGDLWAYDAASSTWTELHPAGAKPPARAFHSMVYDDTTGDFLLLGGVGDSMDWFSEPMNDVWAYHPVANSWEQLHPNGKGPSSDERILAVYDPVARKVIASQLDRLWAYDPATNVWTSLRPKGQVPDKPIDTMMYEPLTGRILVFGGTWDMGFLSGSWAYEAMTNTFTELPSSSDMPQPRIYYCAAGVPNAGKMLVFGGLDTGNVPLHDFWQYDAAADTWTMIRPSGPQNPRGGYGNAMTYNSSLDRLIMFGGGSLQEGVPTGTWCLSL